MVIPQFKVLMADNVEDFILPTLKSGMITQGKRVEEFEEDLSIYLDFDYGVTVNSATSGLMLALKLAGIEPGDWVISTPMTCSATNEAIVLMGANIVWADVDRYGNIDAESLVDPHIWENNPKAIVAVDWGGLPCDYDALRQHGLPIIEDAAHAFGAQYKGISVARNGGDYVVYSFQAIKHLTCGDGGLVVCPDEATYHRAKLLRWYGLDRTQSDAMRSRQDILEVGWKFHMNDIAASIGLANLPWMDRILTKHRNNARYYDTTLEDLRPDWPWERLSSFWAYTIHVPDAKGYEEYAKANGFVASPIHVRNDHYTAFEQFRRDGELPGLERFSADMVCIPVGWWLTFEDQDRIILKTREWISDHR